MKLKMKKVINGNYTKELLGEFEIKIKRNFDFFRLD